MRRTEGGRGNSHGAHIGNGISFEVLVRGNEGLFDAMMRRVL